MNPDELLTPGQAAEHLRCSARHVRALCRDELLGHLVVSAPGGCRRHVRIPRRALVDFQRARSLGDVEGTEGLEGMQDVSPVYRIADHDVALEVSRAPGGGIQLTSTIAGRRRVLRINDPREALRFSAAVVLAAAGEGA